jgi:DNA-binding LytR/AlgR family response regulator
MIQCIALDDDPLALELIRDYCSSIPYLELQRTFTKSDDAIRYLKHFPVDLLFLDVQMPEMRGTDFYKKFALGSMVIFTTAYSEFAVEAFNVRAIDYLQKPLEFNRFLKGCEKAKMHLEYRKLCKGSEYDFIHLRSNYSLVRIMLPEILYIESIDDHIKIYQSNKKMLLSATRLKDIVVKLPIDFIRVHNSYIVPFSRIWAVKGKTIFIEEIEIPIGKKYEKDFFSRIHL